MNEKQAPRELLTRAAIRMDLPPEIMAGLPQLELTGFHELSVERHLGIRSYGQEEIVLEVNLGMIRICGKNLSVKRMNRERIVLTGEIASIALEAGG